MNDFKKIMELLYSSKINDVLRAINQSKFIGDLTSLKDDFIVHTGFTFRIHSKVFELFYDIETNLLIRQPKNDIIKFPSIAGLEYKFERKPSGNYLNKYLLTAIISFSQGDDDYEYSHIEYPSLHSIQHSTIQFKNWENGEITQLPIQRELKELLVLKNNLFSIYISDEELNREREREEERYQRHRDMLDDADREMNSWNDDYPGWWMGRD